MKDNQANGIRSPRSKLGVHLFVVVTVALLLRGTWLYLMSTQFSGHDIGHLLYDSIRYINVAHYLLGWPEHGDYPSYSGGAVYSTGEGALMWSGPGYGAFLAACYFAFGDSNWPVLIAQVLLSTAGCVFVFLIAQQLLGASRISLIAGLISALSLTSISLSCLIVTDTLFFTLHAAGLLCLILAFHRNNLGWFVAAGLSIGLSAYVRAVAQFWPVAIVILAFMLPRRFIGGSRRSLVVKASLSFLLALSFILAFCLRNYARHGIFTFTTGGAMAARYYWTARTLASLDSDPNMNARAMQHKMMEDNRTRFGPEGTTVAEYYHDDMKAFLAALKEYPGPMAKRFLKSAFQNTTRGSDIHPIQLPQYKSFWDKIEPVLSKNVGRVIFAFTLLGFIILLLTKDRRAAGLVLLFTYGYILGISGFEFWQGSRICHPAMLAWAIVIAVVLDRVINHYRILTTKKSDGTS